MSHTTSGNPSRAVLLVALVVLGCLSSCMAAHNVTLDDTAGDESGTDPSKNTQLIYEPGFWDGVTLSPQPGDINPDNIPSSAQVTAANPGFQFPGQSHWLTVLFNGTAVYVDFILSTGLTVASFYLDDVEGPGSAFEASTTIWNTTVYANTNVVGSGTGPFGAHNLTVVSPSNVFFDFVTYTVPDADD